MRKRLTCWQSGSAVLSLLLTGISAPHAAEVRVARPVPRRQIIAYVFPQQRAITPGEIDAGRVTRINYAFANISKGQVVEGTTFDPTNLAMLHGLKRQNPSLEVTVSVGGWLWSGQFSDAVVSPASRAKFIESAVSFVRRYELDGIDLDWEYPGLEGAGNKFRTEDGHNFTLLLREMRARFDREEPILHRHLVLSIAAGSSDEYLAHTELAEDQEVLDTINLMAYDYYEPGDGHLTGNHAPLFGDPLDPKKVSADASVRALEKSGVKAAKIVLGVPFYGHTWGNVPAINHGLFQPGTAVPNMDAGYHAIATTMLNHGFVRYWDDAAKVPYLYNETTRQFISYEDPESLAGKCAYVRDHDLAGVMFWEYFNDPDGRLLQAIAHNLHEPAAGSR